MGFIKGIRWGSTIGVTQGEIRSLDSSSLEPKSVEHWGIDGIHAGHGSRVCSGTGLRESPEFEDFVGLLDFQEA